MKWPTPVDSARLVSEVDSPTPRVHLAYGKENRQTRGTGQKFGHAISFLNFFFLICKNRQLLCNSIRVPSYIGYSIWPIRRLAPYRCVSRVLLRTVHSWFRGSKNMGCLVFPGHPWYTKFSWTAPLTRFLTKMAQACIDWTRFLRTYNGRRGQVLQMFQKPIPRTRCGLSP